MNKCRHGEGKSLNACLIAIPLKMQSWLPTDAKCGKNRVQYEKHFSPSMLLSPVTMTTENEHPTLFKEKREIQIIQPYLAFFHARPY